LFGVFARDLADGGILGADETTRSNGFSDSASAPAGRRTCSSFSLVIRLVLLERVRARGRPGEESYRLDDMRRLDAAYARWLSGWRLSPVIAVSAIDRDLRDMTKIERLAAAVSQMVRIPGA
jgi:hypothetical protein